MPLYSEYTEIMSLWNSLQVVWVWIWTFTSNVNRMYLESTVTWVVMLCGLERGWHLREYSKQQSSPGSCVFLMISCSATIWLWRWRLYVSPKCCISCCITQCYNPENCTFHSHWCESFKLNTEFDLLQILFHKVHVTILIDEM